MENYMSEKIVIGGYTIDGIEMLDDVTCCLYFEAFKEGDNMTSIVVEKWLDDDSWHFMDNHFEEYGYFIDAEESTHLSEEEKEECKNFINSWIEDLEK